MEQWKAVSARTIRMGRSIFIDPSSPFLSNNSAGQQAGMSQVVLSASATVRRSADHANALVQSARKTTGVELAHAWDRLLVGLFPHGGKKVGWPLEIGLELVIIQHQGWLVFSDPPWLRLLTSWTIIMFYRRCRKKTPKSKFCIPFLEPLESRILPASDIYAVAGTPD